MKKTDVFKSIFLALHKRDYNTARMHVHMLETSFPRNEHVDVRKELQEIVPWSDVWSNFQDSHNGSNNFYYVIAAKELYPENKILELDNKRIGSLIDFSFDKPWHDNFLHRHCYSADCCKSINQFLREKGGNTMPNEKYPAWPLLCLSLLATEAYEAMIVAPENYAKKPLILSQQDKDLLITIVSDAIECVVSHSASPTEEKDAMSICKNILLLYHDARCLDDIRSVLPQVPDSFWQAVRSRVNGMNQDEDGDRWSLEACIVASLSNVVKLQYLPDFYLAWLPWEKAKEYLDHKATVTLGSLLFWSAQLLNTKVHADSDVQTGVN